MDIYIYIIPLTILIAAIGLFFLMWAIKTGQYDDCEKNSTGILMIDEKGEGVEEDKKTTR